jgi:hypothetical protein
LLAALALGACRATHLVPPAPLASAHFTGDFDSYRLGRVGFLPLASSSGEELTADQGRTLQAALLLELAQVADFELVRLEPGDLAEVPGSEPYRRGRYLPRTILELARRYDLDGLFVGTVTHLQPFPPQALALSLDLVSCETGMVLWTSSIRLDADDRTVHKSLAAWSARQRSDASTDDSMELTLISPSRFARFAAHEVARSF